MEHGEKHCPSITSRGRSAIILRAEGRHVEVGIGIDQDGILTAHFEHGTLDPDLPGLHVRCANIDVEANFFRASECDVARLGMLDQGIAEGGA